MIIFQLFFYLIFILTLSNYFKYNLKTMIFKYQNGIQNYVVISQSY